LKRKKYAHDVDDDDDGEFTARVLASQAKAIVDR